MDFRVILDTEEVTGSIPVSPTTNMQVIPEGMVTCQVSGCPGCGLSRVLEDMPG
jgi:ferredoxin-like protein FixX